MNVQNFPLDWLNAFSDKKCGTIRKQKRFEKIVQKFIDEEGLLLLKPNEMQIFSFAMFGASIGAFALTDHFKDLQSIDNKIEMLGHHHEMLDKIKSENPTLAALVSTAENIHNSIID